MSAWNSGAVGIVVLMTTDTVQAGHTFSFRPTDHICDMSMTIVALLWIVCSGVTVDAAR